MKPAGAIPERRGQGHADMDGAEPRRVALHPADIESFNGKLRDECLSVEWFRSRAEARSPSLKAIRPHSSLNYLTPLEFKQQHHPIPNRAVFQE